MNGQSVGVPPVLLSGHHGQIARWRREQALQTTVRQRPELIVAARAAGRLSAQDEQFIASVEVYSKAFRSSDG
jgi:tRNA (guanine37-N1)-methyltransferase